MKKKSTRKPKHVSANAFKLAHEQALKNLTAADKAAHRGKK